MLSIPIAGGGVGLWWFLPAAGQLLTTMHSLRFLPLAFALLSALVPVQGQLMPQDNWIYTGQRVSGSFRALHIAKDNLIYVGSTNVIAVLDTDLNFVRQFGTVGTVLGIASDSQTNIYVLETSTVKIYNRLSGVLLNQWGSAGTNNGQFTVPSIISANTAVGSSQPQVNGLAIDRNDELFIANHPEVLVVSTNGVFLRKWRTAAGQTVPFSDPAIIGITSTGDIVVVHHFANNLARQFFKPDGTFISSVVINPTIIGSGGRQIATTPDGLLLIAFRRSTLIDVFDSSKNLLTEFSPFTSTFLRSQIVLDAAFPDLRVDGMGVSTDGDLYLLASSWEGTSVNGTLGISRGVIKLKRLYSKEYLISAASSIPQPRIESVAQRPGSAYLDLDFYVRDADSTTVQVAVLGFTNGVNNLTGVIRMTNIVEGTITNLGAIIPANTTRRVTWDPTIEWNVGFGNIQFEVLAKDERGLLPFHFITVPASGTNATNNVSDRAITDADFLSLWFWLVATSDSEVQFTLNREVYGTGTNNLVKYASGITTTAAGRTYLLSRLGVRAITAAEVTQANGGRYGFPATVTTNHVVKLIP